MVDFNPQRVLVVDDEPLVAESIRMVLSAIGHSAEVVRSGEEALAKYTPERYDLVLTDLKMPGMQGDELAARIKALSPDQPVVMLTGFPPKQKPEAVDLVILKPFSVDSVRAAVEQFGAVGRKIQAAR